ncbi:MAG: hypothetical protein JXR94_23905, partial [Candidatus Hydrogenedentes bacterium]|nr:hypothetical protein [Candidatus Hydrogenedentota bacterium]
MMFADRRRTRFVVGWGALVVLAVAAAGQAPAARLENARLRVAFDSDTGRLTEFTDPHNGHPFVDGAPDDALWRLALTLPSGARELSPADAAAFSFARPEESMDTLELTWAGFGLDDAPALRVTVTVSLAADGSTALWRIAIEDTAGLPINAVRFPRLP